MAYTRTTVRFTSTLIVLPIGGLTLALAGEAAAATPTYYNNEATFTSDIMENVIDDYVSPGYTGFLGDAAMSAVLGETVYQPTQFPGVNVAGGGFYCAGCNGSFRLTFTSTSVGEATGVNGVGVAIANNDVMVPYTAYIVFADGTTEEAGLPPGASFWGVSAPERIESVHFGLAGGFPTSMGYFELDRLIVGDGMDETPCGDGIATPDEECDDAGVSAECDANCTFAICGDGTFNMLAGEICDDGGASPTCNDDCTAPSCGDGVVNELTGETCDESGVETATCDLDCTAATCGDNIANTLAGEECDDSAASPSCDADCTFVVCGDGTENNVAGEYCDDGNLDDGDGCSSTCTNEEVETSEEGGESSGVVTGSESSGGESGGPSTATGDTGESSSGAAVDESTGGGDESSTGPSVSTTVADSSGGDEESSGGASAGMNDDASGCSCSTEDPRRGAAWSVLGLLGLGALKRRRRAA